MKLDTQGLIDFYRKRAHRVLTIAIKNWRNEYFRNVQGPRVKFYMNRWRDQSRYWAEKDSLANRIDVGRKFYLVLRCIRHWHEEHQIHMFSQADAVSRSVRIWRISLQEKKFRNRIRLGVYRFWSQASIIKQRHKHAINIINRVYSEAQISFLLKNCLDAWQQIQKRNKLLCVLADMHRRTEILKKTTSRWRRVVFLSVSLSKSEEQHTILRNTRSRKKSVLKLRVAYAELLYSRDMRVRVLQKATRKLIMAIAILRLNRIRQFFLRKDNFYLWYDYLVKRKVIGSSLKILIERRQSRLKRNVFCQLQRMLVLAKCRYQFRLRVAGRGLERWREELNKQKLKNVLFGMQIDWFVKYKLYRRWRMAYGVRYLRLKTMSHVLSQWSGLFRNRRNCQILRLIFDRIEHYRTIHTMKTFMYELRKRVEHRKNMFVMKKQADNILMKRLKKQFVDKMMDYALPSRPNTTAETFIEWYE
ncbi:hypothetical protein PCE1_002583 [Barthelona sp. PCE]